jgi:hypothetical protein
VTVASPSPEEVAVAEPVRAVLVIGATGILGPAVQTLVERGTSVVAVARDATALAELVQTSDGNGNGPSVTVRAVDARDAVALAGAVDGLSLAGAIGYGPAVSADSWTVLARLVDGPVVQVLTSSATDPSRPPLPAPTRPFARLILGWTADGRWHTPAEVSAAAVHVLDDAATAASRAQRTPVQRNPGQETPVLGRVRPWAERPI